MFQSWKSYLQWEYNSTGKKKEKNYDIKITLETKI